MVAPCYGHVPSFPPLAPSHALVHDIAHSFLPAVGWALWVPLVDHPLPLVTGSHLLSPLLGGFPVCLVVNALANPGFHLVQTIGLSQAVYQAYACGGQSFSWKLTPGLLTVLPSWGIAYHALFFPCLKRGLG